NEQEKRSTRKRSEAENGSQGKRVLGERRVTASCEEIARRRELFDGWRRIRSRKRKRNDIPYRLRRRDRLNRQALKVITVLLGRLLLRPRAVARLSSRAH